MNKKALSLGMIVPLAAAGAVATAPAASAASVDTGYRHSKVDLDLNATPLRRSNWIKVVVKLDTNERHGRHRFNDRGRDRGSWVVVIRKNGRVIEVDRERTRHGRLKVVEFTYDGRGTDRFSATAYNRWTGQFAYDRDVVKKWEKHSR